MPPRSSTTETPTSSQPSCHCMLVWKGYKGDQEQGSMRSVKGQRCTMPQCHPRYHGRPGKVGPHGQILVYRHHLQNLDTYVHTHTQTHAYTQKEKIQTFNVEKIWMC